MAMRFENKIVLVLGGNSGMGLAAARAFAGEGARVHLTGRDPATIDVAVASIPGAVGYSSDISDVAATERVVAQVEAADGRIGPQGLFRLVMDRRKRLAEPLGVHGPVLDLAA